MYPYAQTAEEKNRLWKSVVAKVEYEKTESGRGKGGPTHTLKLIVFPKIVLQH